MDIQEYKRRKESGNLEIRVEGRRVVARYPVYDTATGKQVDVQEKTLSAEAIEARLDVAEAEAESLRELLAEINGAKRRAGGNTKPVD